MLRESGATYSEIRVRPTLGNHMTQDRGNWRHPHTPRPRLHCNKTSQCHTRSPGNRWFHNRDYQSRPHNNLHPAEGDRSNRTNRIVLLSLHTTRSTHPCSRRDQCRKCRARRSHCHTPFLQEVRHSNRLSNCSRRSTIPQTNSHN